MRIPGKMFGKICLKAFRNTFFSNMWSVIRGGKKGLTFWWKVISNRRGKFKLLGLQEEPPPSPSPLVGHPNFSIRKILRRVLGLLTVFGKCECAYLFQSNKFTACKVKDRKEEANSSIYWRLSIHLKVRKL